MEQVQLCEAPVSPVSVDLCSADPADDFTVALSWSGLCRIALVASEAGANFDRLGGPEDALEWLAAPLDMFGGRRPLDVVHEPSQMMKAVLFHRLGGRWDGEADLLDDLIAGEGRDVVVNGEPSDDLVRSGADDAPRLFCAVSRCYRGGRLMGSLVATFARQPDEMLDQVAAVLGPQAGRRTVVSEGFLPIVDLVRQIVPEGLVAVLLSAELSQASGLMPSFRIVIERELAH